MLLQVTDVSKSYDTNTVLDDVNLSLDAGEMKALVGRNGVGKSTLVSIIAGVIPPDSGSVLVNGLVTYANPLAQRLIGWAPQELGIYPVLTVEENLCFFGRLAGLKGGELTRRVKRVAELLGLTKMLGKPAGILSGGEQKRVHTGMAIVHEPELLLLDEPTAGVDVLMRSDLLVAIKELCDRGKGVLYTTHYFGEVEELNAGVIILERQRVLVEGTIAELSERYGYSAVKLTFNEAPPQISSTYSVAYGANSLLIGCERCGEELPHIIRAIGAAVDELKSIEIKTAGLESVFVHLTEDQAISNAAAFEAN